MHINIAAQYYCLSERSGPSVAHQETPSLMFVDVLAVTQPKLRHRSCVRSASPESDNVTGATSSAARMDIRAVYASCTDIFGLYR